MGTHAEFRNYAGQCIEIARKTNNQVLRETMLEMAETWLGLAGASQLEFDQVRDNELATHGMGSSENADVA